MKETFQLYIDGDFVDPESDSWFTSINPYTGEEWAEIPRGTKPDVDAAVNAAKQAVFHGEWADFTPTERGEYLFELADELEDYATKHTEYEVNDTGKPIREMEGNHESVPKWFRYYAGLADKIRGDTITPDKQQKRVATQKEPVGVVGAITPWNFPLLLGAWKLAPALAAGNAVVLKPDEKTSASSLSFADAVDAVGFPDGVINIVSGYGEEAGEALTTNDDVDKISFTGGTETGSNIASTTGSNLTNSTMELGGKSPNIVFADANLDNAVNGALASIFRGVGESCSAGSRLLLHEDIHDEFVELLVNRTHNITPGDPKDHDTEYGPLISQPHYNKVKRYVDLGIEEGATLVCGGEPLTGLESELFFEPTIFTNVDNSSRLAQEEVFGPVLAVISFETEEEAIEIANDVDYGLASYVWTEDIRRAFRVSDQIRAGRVCINDSANSGITAPQGGYKASGWGVENGVDAVEEFLQTKAIWLEMDEETPNPFN